MKYAKIVILFCFCVICILIPFHIQTIKTTILYPEKPIHIFYESLATQPALSGMINLVQLPKDELKLFAWHRFPSRSNLVDLKSINAIEIPINYAEGHVVINARKFIPIIEKYLERYPKSPVIIYTNANNYDYFFSKFLPKIDKNRIKRLHLYEDGLGELFSYSHYFQNLAFDEKHIQDFKTYYYDKSKKSVLPKNAKYMWQTLFPTTYHFYGLEKAKKNQKYYSFFREMKGAEFKDINFKKLVQTLTPEQKNLLFKLVGFDYDFYQKKMYNQKTFMYFTGFHRLKHHVLNHAELNYLKTLIDKYPDYHFFVKPHPSYSAMDRTKIIQQQIPSVDIIVPQIPYEIFIIADLVPSYVSGYASSLFYTLDDNKVKAYFPHYAYVKGFDLLKKFNTTPKLNLKHYIPQHPIFYDFIIHKNNKKDYVILQNKTSAFVYLEKTGYEYKKQNNTIFLCSDTTCNSYIKNNDEYHYKSIDTLKVNHTYWSDFLIQKKDNVYCRFDGDCGTLKKAKNTFTICWNEWGCETFYQTSPQIYQLKKETKFYK